MLERIVHQARVKMTRKHSKLPSIIHKLDVSDNLIKVSKRRLALTEVRPFGYSTEFVHCRLKQLKLMKFLYRFIYE